MAVIEGTSERYYEVGSLVAEADQYRLYLCTQVGTGRQCLFQIATETAHNGTLDRAAFLLQELEREAQRLEAEYAKVRGDPNKCLNYNLGFPKLVDSFACDQQGGRRVSILAFRNVDDVSRLVPIGNITERDRKRVDLRTSAWVVGKGLKILVFAHSQGIAIRRVNGANILIEPDQHYVVFFDWSATQTFSGIIPADVRIEEISQVAKAGIIVLGGDPNTGEIPNDGDAGYDRYTEHLLRLARGSESNAERAHARFYKLIDELWEHEFHPFLSRPLD